MLVLLSITLLAVAGAGEHACTSPSEEAILDDTTAFIQSRLEKVVAPVTQVTAPAQIKDAQEGVPNLDAQAASGSSPPTVVDSTIKEMQNSMPMSMADEDAKEDVDGDAEEDFSEDAEEEERFAEEEEGLEDGKPKKKKGSAPAQPSMIMKALAEFVAMTLFVFVGCGSAMAVANTPGYAWVLQVSLTFGFAITVLAYTIGHYSGGQINSAVTLGLVIAGHVTIVQGVVNIAAQVLGAILGSALTLLVFKKTSDATGGLGTNQVSRGKDKFTVWQALLAEIMGTFLLVFVVLETAVDPHTKANRAVACLAIGLAVFLAHSVLIPIDGCSINPTRSLGPAIIRTFTHNVDHQYWMDMWIFLLGPNLGAALAALLYKLFSHPHLL